MKTKTCSKCGVEKSLIAFSKDAQKSDGHRPDCRSCNGKVTSSYAKRNRETVNFNNLKWKTGINKEQYLQILGEQGGKCAICGMTEEQNDRKLSIDHCHSTKLVRGLLCTRCNQGLGYFRDAPKLLEAASNYLINNLKDRKIKYGKS